LALATSIWVDFWIFSDQAQLLVLLRELRSMEALGEIKRK